MLDNILIVINTLTLQARSSHKPAFSNEVLDESLRLVPSLLGCGDSSSASTGPCLAVDRD